MGKLSCRYGRGLLCCWQPAVKEDTPPAEQTTVDVEDIEVKMADGDKHPKVRTFTRDEVEQSSQDGNFWVIISNSVYDVKEFMWTHPGGQKIFLPHIGLDASAVFEDVGHSIYAVHMMKQYLIGNIVDSQRRETYVIKEGITDDEQNT